MPSLIPTQYWLKQVFLSHFKDHKDVTADLNLHFSAIRSGFTLAAHVVKCNACILRIGLQNCFRHRGAPKYKNDRKKSFKADITTNRSHLNELLDILSEQDLSNITEFINILDVEELQFQRSKEELQQIKNAVSEAVEDFVATIKNHFPNYAASRIDAVGSIVEGTRIIEPDEFDFIVVLRYLHLGDFSIEHVTPTDQDNHSCKLDAPFRHLHLRMCPSTKIPDTLTYQGYLRNWTNILYPNEEKLAFYWNFKNNKHSGQLKFCNSNLNGPAITLKLKWKPQQGRKLYIDVDVVFAIEMTSAPDLLDGSIKDYNRYTELVHSTNTYFIIPNRQYYSRFEPSKCFKHSFVKIELAIMTSLSPNHKICYRFLKYLLQEQYKAYEYNKVNTYVLKTALIKHTANCDETSNAATCMINVIKCLEEYNSFPEELFIKKTISCQVGVLKQLLVAPKKQMLCIANRFRGYNDFELVLRLMKKELEDLTI